MPNLIEGESAALPADDRWDGEMRGLWGLLPIFGTLASGTVDARSVVERTAQTLDARALVALTPTPTGIAAIVAVKGEDEWQARTAGLDQMNWERLAQDPSAALDLGLKEAHGVNMTGSWTVGWAVGSRLLVGVAPGSRRPSQEGLDLAATLMGWGFGQAEGSAAAGQHALLRERSRIASVIHEGLTQVVTNVAIQLQILERHLDDPVKARSMVTESRSAVTHALDDLRGAIFELAPRGQGPEDFAEGLARYLDDFCAQWGLDVTFEAVGDERKVEPDVVALIFAFVQEALTNLRKHAGTSEGSVSLTFEDGVVRVEVHDDGKGFDPDAKKDEGYRQHQGLDLLRSRVWLMGGQIDVFLVP